MITRDNENIETILINIFMKRANIDLYKYPNLKEKKLFGDEISMPVRELLLALYDIEEQLNIYVPEKVFTSGEFDTFNNIYNIVKKLKISY